jgi:hypothetical protein
VKEAIMLTRREFVTGPTVLVIMTPLAIACGDNDEPTNACSGAGANSSVVEGHSHFVCVAAADLMAPPSAGVTYRSTMSDGHDHDVTLSADELTALASNESVTITSAVADGHTHQFMLRRTTSGSSDAPSGPIY